MATAPSSKLVAENAQGKSAVLAAASLALDPIVSELSGVRPHTLRADSVRVELAGEVHMQPCLPMRLKAHGEVRGVSLGWARSRASLSAYAGGSRRDLTAATAEARELRRLALADSGCLLPVVAFYRTDRLWSSMGGALRRSRPDRSMQGRWLGYADWTSPTSSFGAFLGWYRGAFTQLGSATSKFGDAGSRIEKQIVAVHEAVRTALQPTGWTAINWERAEGSATSLMGRDFISIEHQSRGRLPLQFLSDGIQNMVALVADLAYRCVVLNPHLGEAPVPETVTYPTLLDDLAAPSLRAYPVYTVIAEKLHAMVVLGMNNSRMKDFFDLAVIARTSALDGRTLVDAIRATFAKRNTSLPRSTPAALSTEFSSNPIKAQQWRAFVTKAGLQWSSLEEVVDALAVFLNPAIAACSVSDGFESKWNPVASEWGVGDGTSQR